MMNRFLSASALVATAGLLLAAAPQDANLKDLKGVVKIDGSSTVYPITEAVAIDGGKGAVMPTVESIEDGSYAPFSRPLFIYVSKASAGKPEVKAFVDFYLTNVAKLAGEVGYVKLPDAVYSRVRANWTNGRTGSQFIDAKGDHVTGSLAEFYT